MELCTTVDRRSEPFVRTLITAHFHGRKHIGPSGEHYPTYKKLEWLMSHGFSKEEAKDIISNARHRVFAESNVQVLAAPPELGEAQITDDGKAEIAMLLAGEHVSPAGFVHHHVDLYPHDDGTVFLQILDRQFQVAYEGDASLCSLEFIGDIYVHMLLEHYTNMRDKEHHVPVELLRETERIIKNKLPYAMMIHSKGFNVYSSTYHRIAVITKQTKDGK